MPDTPAEPAEDPRHQTTVAPIAPSDRPSGPKMRTPSGASAGADPDGWNTRGTIRGGVARPTATGTGRDGMLGQDRGSVAAVRTPPDRRGEASRDLARPSGPGRFPGGSACRQEQAGRCTGTLPAAGRSGDAAAGRRPARCPGAPCSPRAGGLVLVLAFPGYDLPALAVLGPAALALAVRGQRFRSGLWLGLVFGLAFFVPLLSWTGIYVGSVPVAGPRRVARRCTWRSSAAPPR